MAFSLFPHGVGRRAAAISSRPYISNDGTRRHRVRTVYLSLLRNRQPGRRHNPQTTADELLLAVAPQITELTLSQDVLALVRRHALGIGRDVVRQISQFDAFARDVGRLGRAIIAQ